MQHVLIQFLQRNSHDGYLFYHAPRYNLLLEKAQAYYQPGGRILDIGRSPFCEILSQFLGQKVDSMGLQDDEETTYGRHFHYNLNRCIDVSDWRLDIGDYQLVLMAEVIEHIGISPRYVLEYLKKLMIPQATLILQTPNAVSLRHRVKMLIGRNPYELLGENPKEPGHIREYTRAELERYCGEAGFQLVEFCYASYFDHRYRGHLFGRRKPEPTYQVLNLIEKFSPGSLKPGMTMVLQKVME